MTVLKVRILRTPGGYLPIEQLTYRVRKEGASENSGRTYNLKGLVSLVSANNNEFKYEDSEIKEHINYFKEQVELQKIRYSNSKKNNPK